jgi:hypothetical protein
MNDELERIRQEVVVAWFLGTIPAFVWRHSETPWKPSIRIAGRRGRESKAGPPEYEAGVLTTRPQCSVTRCQNPRHHHHHHHHPHHHQSQNLKSHTFSSTNEPTPWSTDLLEMKVKISAIFYGSRRSSLHSQEPVTSPYHQPHESNTRYRITFH